MDKHCEALTDERNLVDASSGRLDSGGSIKENPSVTPTGYFFHVLNFTNRLIKWNKSASQKMPQILVPVLFSFSKQHDPLCGLQSFCVIKWQCKIRVQKKPVGFVYRAWKDHNRQLLLYRYKKKHHIIKMYWYMNSYNIWKQSVVDLHRCLTGQGRPSSGPEKPKWKWETILQTPLWLWPLR